MHLDSVDQKSSRDFVAESMYQKLGGDDCLSEHLIPKYALGCRRMTPGSNYLQSLLSPNVQVIAQSAVEVTPTGLVDSAGNHTEVDVIIFATGFDTSFSPAYTVVGQNGRTLREEWGDFPKAYLSLMARNFPNMFRKSPETKAFQPASSKVTCPVRTDFDRALDFPGPNGPASHGSVLPILEWHTRYLFKVISHMQRTLIKSLEPSAEAVADLYVHTHELLKRTAWSS